MEKDPEAYIPLNTSPYNGTEFQFPRQSASLKDQLVSWLHENGDVVLKVALSLIVFQFVLSLAILCGVVSNKNIVLNFQEYISFTSTLFMGVMVQAAVVLVMAAVVFLYSCLSSGYSISYGLSYGPLKPQVDLCAIVLGVTCVFSFLTLIQMIVQKMIGVPPGAALTG